MKRGFLQEDEAKMSSTPVQLEGVSRHRLEGGDREAELAVRLVKQSVWSVETVTEDWFSGRFYEATIKYDFFLGQPWLHAHRVSPMGHRTCFLQDPSTSDPSDLYYLHPYTKSVHQFKERNKLHIQRDGQEWTGNQEQFAEGKVESLNCKKWKSVCYRVREQSLTEIVYIHYKVSCLGPRQGNWRKPSLDPTEIKQTDTTISWNAGMYRIKAEIS